MLASQTPTLVPLAFAANGTKNTIPETSQIGVTPGAASLNDGFPPLTFTPVAAGGIPPAGGDFNGILNLITSTIRWQHAGGQFKWNSAFATDTNVGGYPAGAVLERADGAGFWLNLVDNNATNPDATDGSAANWVPLESYGITAVTGLTNANVTLTPPQYGLPIITLSGTLIGNVQIIFPAIKSQWLVINNTTGNFTLTCKTSGGTGVAVAQGGGAQLYGDGTNIVLPNAQQVGPATAAQHAVQLGQVGHGQCRLSATNATTLTLAPYGGNNLIINGVPRQIPGAGVTISNASLAASTVYYVYASWTGSAIQLNISATGHSTATSGIETKTGDTTQTLVGMIATNSSSQFVDSATQRFTLNWFNRRGLLGGTGYNTPTSFAVQTATEITSNLRVSFLSWADEAVYFNTEGTVSNNSAGSTVTVQTYIQGTPFGSIVSATSAIANAKVPFSSTATTGNLEGTINVIELYGSVDANTGTLQSGAIHFQTKG